MKNLILYLIIIFMLLFIISFLTLWERKLLAGIQRRQGPVFTGLAGLLQPFADGLKLLLKSVIIPSGVYFYIYIFSAIFSIVSSLLLWTLIPFNQHWVISDNNLGLFLFFMISSVNALTILFSGWSSNSKYGLLGSIRSGAQLISYEIPLMSSILPILFTAQTANLTNIVNFQSKTCWFVCIFPVSIIFLITLLAESNRTPFDLPEAEPELIAGFHIEYSALVFALYFLSEYNHILVSSYLFSILFLGGWLVDPFPLIFRFHSFYCVTISKFTCLVYAFTCKVPYFVGWLLNCLFLNDWGPGRMYVIWLFYRVHEWWNNLFYFMIRGGFQSLILSLKAIFIASTFIVLRGILPRYKYSDVLQICWKIFIPFTAFFVFSFFLSFLCMIEEIVWVIVFIFLMWQVHIKRVDEVLFPAMKSFYFICLRMLRGEYRPKFFEYFNEKK